MDKIRLDIVQYEEWAADKIGAQWDFGSDWCLEGDCLLARFVV